jgi:hypothetical protein
MTEGTNMEFFNGFKWAIPKAFAPALTVCRFERGDILYDSQEAYLQPTWADVLPHLTYSLQVKYPIETRTSLNTGSTLEPDDTIKARKFNQNWHSSVELELTEYEANKKVTYIKTTQGRLYSLLWRGDIKILDITTPEPEIPQTPKEAKKELELCSQHLRQLFLESMDKPNLFLMAYDSVNETALSKYRDVAAELKRNFQVVYRLYTTEALGLDDGEYYLPTTAVACFAIDSSAPEKIRDILKETLWPVDRKPSCDFDTFLMRDKSQTATSFKLINHGLFCPSITRRYGPIKTHSFDHKPFYQYRVAVTKLKNVKDKRIVNYLQHLFTDCPNHIFTDEQTLRASKTCLKINCDLQHQESHKIVEYAKNSTTSETSRNTHTNIQKYFLENYPAAIACEIPVWLEPADFTDYHKILCTKQPITGHIDLLTYEEDKTITVWDYKPHAKRETNAAQQVLIYAIMLSARTGIPLSKISCGYFDEEVSFLFSPADVLLHHQKEKGSVLF